MDTMSAFMRGEAASAAGNPQMVFDWHKAARLIKEQNPQSVRAGLSGYWDYTGGPIWADGKPIPKSDTYVYLSSNWATPQIEIDGDTEACMKLVSEPPEPDQWNAHTYWPDSALKILGIESREGIDE